MDCDWFSERLADFLLDELPESEAVLVQEHLNRCPLCMKTYRDLKGTGKFLGAVPSMRSVAGSDEFKQDLRSRAVMELRNIVASLPPEKRLRLEARRAARLSRALDKMPQAPVPSIFTRGLAVLTAACLVAVAVVLLYPKSRPVDVNLPLAVLSQTVGRVDQFFQKANEPHSPAVSGKKILNGDTFLTGDNGRARIDLEGGGALYLSGQTRLTFRAPQAPAKRVVFLLEAGELGAQTPAPELHEGMDPASLRESRWEIRSELGTVVLEPGSHTYLSVAKSQKNFEGELRQLSGASRVQDRSGKAIADVIHGQRAKFRDGKLDGRPAIFSPVRVPAWRADLVSDNDLAGLLGVKGKVVRQKDGTLAAEFSYSRARGKGGLDDWMSEDSAKMLGLAPNGAIQLPARARLRHSIPFSGPLTMELYLSREGPREAPFAFGLLDANETGVAVDVARNAALQIKEKGRNARNNPVPSRANKNQTEFVRLEILRESSGFVAQVTTAVGKTKTLPMARTKNEEGAGLWLQAMGDPLLFEEIKISGTLSLDWLCDRLSQQDSTP